MAENYETTMKYGDLGPPVRAVVRNDSDGQPPDWSAATAVFILYDIDFETGAMTEIFNRAADIELPTDSSGALRYDWQANDTDRVGRFPGRFVVTNGGVPESYPPDDFIWINIESVGT